MVLVVVVHVETPSSSMDSFTLVVRYCEEIMKINFVQRNYQVIHRTQLDKEASHSEMGRQD